MRTRVWLLLPIMALFFVGVIRAEAATVAFSGLPPGVNQTGVTYLNVTDTITQSSAQQSESAVEYTFQYMGSGMVNITLPGHVTNPTLFLNGVPYVFSQISGASCSTVLPNAPQNCTQIRIAGVRSSETFVLSYLYSNNYPANNEAYNSTFVLIPFSPTALRVVTVLPQGSFLSANPHYSPQTAVFSSNGNDIEVIWSFFQNTPGFELPFTVSYNNNVVVSSAYSPDSSYIIAAIIIVGIIAVLLMIRYYRNRPLQVGAKKKKANPFASLLNDHEKKVLSLIKRGQVAAQKDLITKTGFSKAKMSKIIAKLSRFKLVKLQFNGKFNKIKRI